jgi:hypothetical protein
MIAMLGTIETTNILLLLIVGLLGACLIVLEKIKIAVEISRNLQWTRQFGRPYREGTRKERRTA